ncbi:hypothetical protein T12_10626 [Trichinella patagoniensis]|uniref:Uncharacterized protein n=1 Tax=Trichinella patagoniensis TaxID=990121 RepID=A0A0V1AH97_9BILA|nr:hypothetical protein T12_10626 [Trichinella patagoniensis]
MNLESMLRIMKKKRFLSSVTNRKVFTKETFSILFIATDKVINLQIAVTGLEIHSDAISFSPPNHFYDDFNTEELRETFGVSNHEKSKL